MNANDLKITMMPIGSLKAYEHNTRAHNDEDVGQIAKSIERYGFNDPIGIWGEENTIVEGHGRLMAARQLGLTEVPCVRLDHLTDEQRREYGIMHNKTAELSEWDFSELERELAELDLSEFGLSFDADEALEDTEEELLQAMQEDTAPEPPNNDPQKGPVKQPKSKHGQIWQLGEHRLMCGDSTEQADVDALMDGATADMVVTDPPYNVAIENAQGMRLQNDDMEQEAFFEFLKAAFEQLTRHLKPGGAFYVWHASRTANIFEAALNENALEPRQQLIWVKNALVLGRQDYQWRHEPCWYGWKDGAAHWFTPDRTQTTVEDMTDFEKMSKAELVALCEQAYHGDDAIPTTTIYEKKPLTDDAHPTMKPVKLIGRQIRNSSRPHETVLDLFGGSGTTMIAAEQLGRKAYLMELDPRYCDVIIERWEKFTGKKAQRIR